jgi:xylitol oxidase
VISESPEGLLNWSGSHRYAASELHLPETVDELQTLIAGARGTLQVLGTRHTFTPVGDADELISLERLPQAHAVEITASRDTVTVGPAVTYAELAQSLTAEGFALENLASLPHISVAGAIATATHGSGSEYGNLATSVRGLELVSGAGDRLSIGAGDPRLPGAAVHLGALGALTAVTLAIEPFYELRQDVFLGLEWDVLAAHFDEVMAAGRSVSVFHDFGERTREVWVKADPARTQPATLCGALPARIAHHPVPGGDPANCTEQLGSPGPWSERLPHFRPGFTPSSGEEIQSEWFVAREHALDAITALRPLAGRIQQVLQIAELRVIAGDDLWMSPQYGRESAGLHFTWRLDPAAVMPVCADIERALAQFDARPHWGKLFTPAGPAWTPERLGDFLALRAELDPAGRFANLWLHERVLSRAP